MVIERILRAIFPAIFPLQLGGGKAPKAPKPIDVNAVAASQQQQNAQNAALQAEWNRIAESTPYGKISYNTGWKDPSSEAAYNQQMQAWQAKRRNAENYWNRGGDGYSAKQVQKYWKSPERLYQQLGVGTAPDIKQFQETTKETTLDPRLQKILEQQWGVQGEALQGAQDYMPRVREALQGEIPEYQPEMFRGQGYAKYEAPLPVADEAYRNKIEAALWGRLNPQMQASKEQLNTRLINQGLRPGGEAWKKAKLDQAQELNDLRLGVTGAGAQEIANQYARDILGYTTGRETQQQTFQNLLAKWAANQGEREKIYGSNLVKRGLPLEELASIMSIGGQQVPIPQSSISGTIDVGQPANMAQLYGMNQQQAMNAYNAQMAQRNTGTQGLFGMARSIMPIAASIFGGMVGGPAGAAAGGALGGGAGMV